MVQNNIDIEERDQYASPVCWYNSDLNLCRQLNMLSATQQNLFYYLIYMGRKTFDKVWDIMWDKSNSSEKYKMNEYINDDWIASAEREHLFEFEVLLADVARAINCKKKTGDLIDDIKAISYTYFEIPRTGKEPLKVYPFNIEITGTERKKMLRIRLHGLGFIYRQEFFDSKTYKVSKKSFNAFKLWDMIRLNSKFSKNLFRLIVQWQKRGETPVYKFKIDMSGLDNIFGIPNSVPKNQYMSRYIQPACDEIGTLLHTTINAIPTYDKGDGRRLAGVKFTFDKLVYARYEVSRGGTFNTINIGDREYLLPPPPKKPGDIEEYLMRGDMEIKIGKNPKYKILSDEPDEQELLSVNAYWVRDWHGNTLPNPILVKGSEMFVEDVACVIEDIYGCKR